MHIFELRYPGTWLKFDDDALRNEIQVMLQNLEEILIEVAISLSMFEAAVATSSQRNPREEFERDFELRAKIETLIREKAGDKYYQNSEAYQLMSESELRAYKYELGILPRSYLHKIPFVHAHTFVYAVDSFGKFLEALGLYESVPKLLNECIDEFNRLIPSVKKIRNSAMHIEDRSRGYGTPSEKRKGKKMETYGFLGLGNLEGNYLCYTIDDGTYQRIEISTTVLNILVKIMNDVILSFQWKGKAYIGPRY